MLFKSRALNVLRSCEAPNVLIKTKAPTVYKSFNNLKLQVGQELAFARQWCLNGDQGVLPTGLHSLVASYGSLDDARPCLWPWSCSVLHLPACPVARMATLTWPAPSLAETWPHPCDAAGDVTTSCRGRSGDLGVCHRPYDRPCMATLRAAKVTPARVTQIQMAA